MTAAHPVADDLFAAIERGDESRLEQLFADDIEVWRAAAERDDDKPRAMKVLRWFIRVTAERRYEILDRQAFPGGFVQQHVLHATGTNGGVIALRVCIVIKVNADDLITRIDEYFDPADLTPILG
ncbi:nuclear transport factor 2 family protein [Candidatus Mycobacterium wuenschmannii]|uniref:Nuclear transport factor 2 family protein n=1 Tax=Candidatus Mycobacterium wuenschmannii TaxID=3027808 RepID=A0ABY8W0J1_9MYCO|nr:nuclear transport factor 2 family protein [Candidatus Mycobacterium wuenschmannii]WIM87967.1 nuclear transport factor 2 family protein [Candidatus Mycobacterium wuenschmannii]